MSTVRGRVVDARGGAAAGAVVNLEIEAGARALLEASMPLSAESDSAGRFELSALPGAIRLRASRGMAQGFTEAVVSAGSPAAGTTSDPLVEIRLDDPVTVRGVVVDAEGTGVSGVAVNALSTLAAGGVNEKKQVETGADGSFELVMPAGHVRLQARTLGRSAPTWVELLGSGTRRDGVRLMLGEEIALRGKVVTPDGLAVVGARVRLVSASSYDAVTGGDGTFEVKVPEVVAYLVKVRHSGGAIQRTVEAWNGDEQFLLQQFGSLEIKAQNAGADVTMTIDSFVPADGSGPRAPAEASYRGPAAGVVVPVIEPGTYDVTVSTPGMKPVAVRGVVVSHEQPAVLPVAFERLGATSLRHRTGRARPC